MLSYNEIKPRKYIILKDEPYEVLDSEVSRKQQRKPVNQTKLRHLISGNVIEETFHHSDKVEEADIEKQTITYLFEKQNELWFCEVDDPSDRFSLPKDTIGSQAQFIPQNSQVSALIFHDPKTSDDDEIIIGIELPIKITLTVKEAPPNVKGNTATGGTKAVTLESGATVNVPLFIKTGDSITVNTKNGEYVGKKTQAKF